MALLAITGRFQRRFIESATLLFLLDHVRGEPSTYGLDQDPNEVGTCRERFLKRKFLDSFALICAIEKGGDSVSAACLEENDPEGTIVRIASNSGVSRDTMSQLQEIAKVLNDIAAGGLSILIIH
jgi:hypothetical protein